MKPSNKKLSSGEIAIIHRSNFLRFVKFWNGRQTQRPVSSGEDNRWHHYTPDFLIRRNDGKCLLIEIKREHDRVHPIDGEQGRKAAATRKWVALNSDKLKYEMIFVSGDAVGYDEIRRSTDFTHGY
jgi:hypothetical protein